MNIHDFIKALEKSTTEQTAKSILQKYLNGFRFRYYAVTYYSRHIKTGRNLIYHCVSPALKPWHEYYLEQGYADIDRTLENHQQIALPLLWDVKQQLKNAKNKREKRMRQESIQFGIDKGLSVPVYGPYGDFAILTLHQFKYETNLRNYLRDQIEWLSATYYFYHTINRVMQFSQQRDPYNLTQREQQCLKLTAKSWRIEQIAKELKIKPRTVNFHLQNANKKMGTNNKYQSVNKYFR